MKPNFSRKKAIAKKQVEKRMIKETAGKRITCIRKECGKNITNLQYESSFDEFGYALCEDCCILGRSKGFGDATPYERRYRDQLDNVFMDKDIDAIAGSCRIDPKVTNEPLVMKYAEVRKLELKK